MYHSKRNNVLNPLFEKIALVFIIEDTNEKSHCQKFRTIHNSENNNIRGFVFLNIKLKTCFLDHFMFISPPYNRCAVLPYALFFAFACHKKIVMRPTSLLIFFSNLSGILSYNSKNYYFFHYVFESIVINLKKQN